ncbi:MAG: phosphoribosylglycinamide formyltransferase [Spirochaetes bacterium GWF1_41_5]|nr:MAG: phosphoribosylglycinamide formyltransferase [Spirochaetes bacterium GWF1_41_5]
MKNKILRIALMVSGRGSNMQVIIENIKKKKIPGAEVCLVVSDQIRAEALITAKEYGISAQYIDPGPFKTKFDEAGENRYIRALQDARTDLICLAGFMRMIKSRLLAAFKGRIINIHPSLLPAFPGLHAQRQALSAQAGCSGCTVHFIDAGMDTGKIIGQTRVPVLPGDTESTLSKRILEQEHILYSRVIAQICSGEITFPEK